MHHFDGQVADESAGPLLLLTAELRRNATVALSGDGADEFFGGYPTYRATRLAQRFGGAIPVAVARSLGKMMYAASAANKTRLPATALLSRFLLGLAAGGSFAHAEWRRYIPEFLLPRLYGSALKQLANVSPMSGYRAAIENAEGPTLLDRCLIADQTWHLPAGLLMKTDAMSMANGVEIRVPFLDRRVMELSGACSLDLIVQPNGPTKPLLRKALRERARRRRSGTRRSAASTIRFRDYCAERCGRSRRRSSKIRRTCSRPICNQTRCARCGVSTPA